MRVRARVTRTVAGLAGALALAASLSACITVHGETAVVPATTEKAAQRVLDHYSEVHNEAFEHFDVERNGTVETGPLAALQNALLTANHGLNPDGAEDFEPLIFTDTRFYIPAQAGWPKFFMADSDTEGPGDDRWLITFTRNSIEEEWKASYISILPPELVPEFAEDADGYVADIPLDGTELDDLAMAPDELGTAYAGTLDANGAQAQDGYLQTGEGPFVDGPFTSDLLQQRSIAEESSVTQYRDWAADEPENAPVAVSTADGRALVLFATHHSDKETWRPEFTPSVDPAVEELMEGEARTSVTRTWIAWQAALVPSKNEGGDIEIIDRRTGVVSAQGD